VSTSDKAALKDLDKNLKMVIFGQDEAIDTLSSAIKLSRAGLKEGEKPIGSFLFAGPTGVGKTEVSRQLARIMGVELVRFDMSEYMERHTVSRLIGAPPGYVGYDQGGLLTEEVTKHPHCVLLLDEVEKAHPEVFNLLLQVMDHGKLTDNNGRSADFRNVVLIMTTNAGAHEMSRASIGFATQDNSTDGMEVLKKMFTPEFRNRLDAMVQFGPLTTDVIKKVVLEVSEGARDWLAVNGYDEAMGARPMQRLIQTKIKKELAEDILFGRLSNGGGIVQVKVVDGDLVLEIEEKSEVSA
jgi:ATP-dependent Clp protease ATP-binding subunit ClpA